VIGFVVCVRGLWFVVVKRCGDVNCEVGCGDCDSCQIRDQLQIGSYNLCVWFVVVK